ncbi:MAG: flagellar basal body rod protein FlgB [Planctomycetota bacterium]
MFFSSLTERGATPALTQTMAFNEARLKVIAENIANASTPNYRAKQLDVKGFQRALSRALEDREAGEPLMISNGQEVLTDDFGHLQVNPRLRPADNVLFHDGTNLSIEREMADLAETGLAHDVAGAFLRRSFDGLRKAIRGTVS